MKTRMMIFFLLFLAGQGVRAQGMPVYDNTNFLTLGKTLIESAKQTAQLLKTANFLKEQKEKIEQVSNVLKQLKAVQEIVDNNQQLFKTVQNDLREILNSPFIRAEEINRITESFNSIIDRSLEDLNFMQQLLTSNYLNMTDSERLLILEAQKERSREMVAEIQLKTKRYRTIISFREIQDKINSRESEF